MGTEFKIILYAPDKETAGKAATAAFARIASLDATMTDYNPTSELMRLCAKSGGDPVHVSDELFFVLSQAQETSRISDGAFDVTVGPVVRLWRQAPADAADARPGEAGGGPAPWSAGRTCVLDEKAHTVQLLKAGMQLDLGGIAKGYAADEGLAVLKKHGVMHALVAAGGDIAVSGPPPDADGWKIAIAPLQEDANTEGPYLVAARRGRVHVRRRGAVRRDRRQTLFAHCRSENGPRPGGPDERHGRGAARDHRRQPYEDRVPCWGRRRRSRSWRRRTASAPVSST